MQLKYFHLKNYIKTPFLSFTGDIRKHNLRGEGNVLSAMVQKFLDPDHESDHHQNLLC